MAVRGCHGVFPPAPVALNPNGFTYIVWNMETGLVRYCSVYDDNTKPETCSTQLGTAQIQNIPPGGLTTGVYEFSNFDLPDQSSSSFRIEINLVGNSRNNPLTILSQHDIRLGANAYIYANGLDGVAPSGPTGGVGGRGGPGWICWRQRRVWRHHADERQPRVRPFRGSRRDRARGHGSRAQRHRCHRFHPGLSFYRRLSGAGGGGSGAGVPSSGPPCPGRWNRRGRPRRRRGRRRAPSFSHRQHRDHYFS